MAIEKIARKIPASLLNIASEKLIDIILNSPNARKMPSDTAKTILYYWQRNQLASETGLQRLLEVSMIIEPAKATTLMEELGLHEIAVMLKSTQH